MKIRQGFVSNSSSSSFCIAKCYMTPEQVTKFQDWLVENRGELCDETHIHSRKYYFIGDISMHEVKLREFLKGIGVDMQYVEEIC